MPRSPPRPDCKTFLVWDSETPPPEGNWFPVYWRGFGIDGKGFSMPLRVEKHGEQLRTRFLAWLYDLGEANVGGCRVIDHLVLRPEFSYWWMTLLTEKSYAKSPRLYDAIRLLALETLVEEQAISAIILTTDDSTLVQVFRIWCGRAGLAFEFRPIGDKPEGIPLARKLIRMAPHPVRAAVFFLCHLWQRWPLREDPAVSIKQFAGQITFVDYLFHLAPSSILSGSYISNYWTNLVGMLKKDRVPTSWLHHYVRNKSVPTACRARDLLASFNRSAPRLESHSTLDSALGWSVIVGTLRDYISIIARGFCLRGALRRFEVQQSNINLWPIFKDEWNNSLFGVAAMENCLYLNLFELVLNRIPHQSLGVYLQENQGWERAFIFAWKAAGHGRLVGVPHTCVNFWDMRFFADVRSYQGTRQHECPTPDLIAANGPAAVAALRQGAYPEDKIAEVEALRYLYLDDIRSSRGVPQTEYSSFTRVLILGDYSSEVTHRQMRLLSKVAHVLSSKCDFVVKPHPASPIDPRNYPLLQLQIVNCPLADLLNNCDVAYTSSSTQAAADAYCAGIPVVSILDGDTFNISPLKGLSGVIYVASPDELAKALLFAPRCENARISLFSLDKELPRWRRVLGLDVPSVTH